MSGRKVPERTPAQQQEHERRKILASLDVAALRDWAERYDIPLLGDDRDALIAMHNTRVLDQGTPARLRKESIAWLRKEHPESMALKKGR